MDIQNEKIFYQDKNVTVTQSRFTSFSKTYAMRNISSVSIYRKGRSRGWEILLIVVGALFCLASVFVAGIPMILLAILLFIILKDSYSVRISSNSGEGDGLVSEDRQYIQTIVNALNDAIIFRG